MPAQLARIPVSDLSIQRKNNGSTLQAPLNKNLLWYLWLVHCFVTVAAVTRVHRGQIEPTWPAMQLPLILDKIEQPF